MLLQADCSPLNKIIIHPSLSGDNPPSECEAPVTQGETNKIIQPNSWKRNPLLKNTISRVLYLNIGSCIFSASHWWSIKFEHLIISISIRNKSKNWIDNNIIAPCFSHHCHRCLKLGAVRKSNKMKLKWQKETIPCESFNFCTCPWLLLLYVKMCGDGKYTVLAVLRPLRLGQLVPLLDQKLLSLAASQPSEQTPMSPSRRGGHNPSKWRHLIPAWKSRCV